MNKDRRTRLMALQQKLNNISTDVESIRDEEQEAYDNMPYSLQASDKGEAVHTALDALQSSIDELTTAIEAIETASSSIDEAQNV